MNPEEAEELDPAALDLEMGYIAEKVPLQYTRPVDGRWRLPKLPKNITPDMQKYADIARQAHCPNDRRRWRDLSPGGRRIWLRVVVALDRAFREK